ncbi:hypothetical protein HanHA300_Chr16g0599791 [Helianthus annuus]|nr:hypothetical protein HanHA300_Chr16g0599791 [Helianthus annuus]KAJ0459551.1 hypothetical protein HanHA89_Chr16g0650241 [Helianthus annuus]
MACGRPPCFGDHLRLLLLPVPAAMGLEQRLTLTMNSTEETMMLATLSVVPRVPGELRRVRSPVLV